MDTLVAFKCYLVKSEMTELVDVETKINLLILTELKRDEPTTQMAVTVTSIATSRTCKQCANDL